MYNIDMYQIVYMESVLSVYAGIHGEQRRTALRI